jgi:hypothetical protein
MIAVEVIRKVPRPAGIILISFLKLVIIFFIITGITTIIARYNIEILKLDIVKNGLTDRIIYYLFPKGSEVRGVLFLGGSLFIGVFLLFGMWSRIKLVWYLEVFVGVFLLFMLLVTIFTINKSELKIINEDAIKIIGEIFLAFLIFSLTFLLYLTKKHVRDYFGIFKRRLR